MRPLGVEPDLVTDCCSCPYQLLYPGFPPLPPLPILSCLLTPLSLGPLRASSCPWPAVAGSLRTLPAHEVWILPCPAPGRAPAALTSPQGLHVDVDMGSQVGLASDANSYSCAHHRPLSPRGQLALLHHTQRCALWLCPSPPSSVRRSWGVTLTGPRLQQLSPGLNQHSLSPGLFLWFCPSSAQAPLQPHSE